MQRISILNDSVVRNGLKQIATPQIIINYAYFSEKDKYFENAFKMHERGVKILEYPHVMDMWTTIELGYY